MQSGCVYELERPEGYDNAMSYCLARIAGLEFVVSICGHRAVVTWGETLAMWNAPVSPSVPAPQPAKVAHVCALLLH